jgi:hypothetical protein
MSRRGGAAADTLGDVVPADSRDLRVVSEIVAEAFHDLPLSRWLTPSARSLQVPCRSAQSDGNHSVAVHGQRLAVFAVARYGCKACVKQPVT